LYHYDIKDKDNIAKNVSARKGQGMDLKIFLGKDMLEELMSQTIVFSSTLCHFTNINGYCFSSNICECTFG